MQQSHILRKYKYHKKQMERYEDMLIHGKTDKQKISYQIRPEEKQKIQEVCAHYGLDTKVLYA
jgi:hypothetical protein